MDIDRITAIQAALDTEEHRAILAAASVTQMELDTIFELALASAAGSQGIAGVRITYPNGRTQILTRYEWQRLPPDVMATVTPEVLTPREYAAALAASRETSP